MSIQLDHEELHRLLAALADSDIQEFRLEGDDFRVEVRRNLPGSSLVPPMMPAPTADPGVAGQLWNSSGTLKVSAG